MLDQSQEDSEDVTSEDNEDGEDITSDCCEEAAGGVQSDEDEGISWEDCAGDGCCARDLQQSALIDIFQALQVPTYFLVSL